MSFLYSFVSSLSTDNIIDLSVYIMSMSIESFRSRFSNIKNKIKHLNFAFGILHTVEFCMTK